MKKSVKKKSTAAKKTVKNKTAKKAAKDLTPITPITPITPADSLNAGTLPNVPAKVDSSNGETDATTEQQTATSDEIKGKGGRAGMHNGHEYKETCNCARCKKQTNKKLNQLSAKDEIIKDESKKLPDGVGVVSILDETFGAMRSKVAQLKAAHPANSEQEFMDSLTNTAIVFYCNSL